MKQQIAIILLCLIAFATHAQEVLIQENFQDWTAQDSAMNYSISKKLFDGKTLGSFTSNFLIVKPKQSIGKTGTAEGNGNPTKGRVAIKGTTTYLQLPECKSIGKINIKASVGTDLKGFKLQLLKNGAYEDIAGTETSCSKTVTKLYTFNLKFASPCTIRIVPTASSNVFIYDLEVLSYVK